VGLFRRREPLHQRLAREGGLTPPDPRPQWQETGIHGIARPREWDATVTVEARDLDGDTARFVALPDGSLLIEEGPDEVEPLAAAVGQTLNGPFRARAARQSDDLWAVQARRIEVLELPGSLDGDTIELTRTAEGTTLSIDEMRSVGKIPALERRGEHEGPEFVVRAERLDGDLWEIRAEVL
jgi:hypothetical protein